MDGTVDLSTSLRSGRDDKGVADVEIGLGGGAEPQISPLRYASVEMTKGCGRGDWFGGGAEPQISPLRYAPVEMTKGLRTWRLVWGWSGTADLSTSLRSGRDDKGVADVEIGLGVERNRRSLHFATLRSRSQRGCGRGDWFWGRSGTADLSTALRSGRDDKGVAEGEIGLGVERNRRSLHFATLRSR